MSQSANRSSKSTLPRRFGNYELLEEIARGGMGVVYRARQVRLNRIVAVKMILAGQLAGAEGVQRFRTEAEAAANLQHPNIVAIHEIGEDDGQHYFSMDYIEGQSLAALVLENPLPATRAARYVRIVAEAIDYAHRKGTLHRDLKPSNVLIDSVDQPRVTDFGLARKVTGGSELTVTGQILGTPNFMPPEQAGAKGTQVGPYSDVYSLGALLYHLVTGRPPFVAETVHQTLIQVLEADPAPPRLLNLSVPRDLDTICLKCLEKEPSRRYGSAAELADDLGRWLRHEPIHARRAGPLERTIKWTKRRPALAALILVGMGAVAGIVWQWREATHAKQAALAKAEADTYESYVANIGVADARVGAGALTQAEDVLERCTPKFRNWEWAWLKARCEAAPRTLAANMDRIWKVAFSPSGKHVVTYGRDGIIRAWSTAGNELSSASGGLVIGENLPGQPFSTNGGEFITWGAPEATRHDLNGSSPDRKFSLGPGHALRAFSTDGNRLFSLCFDKTNQLSTLKVWNAQDGREIASMSERGVVTFLAVANGRRILSLVTPLHVDRAASQERTEADFASVRFIVWDAETGRKLTSLARTNYWPPRFALSGDGELAFTGAADASKNPVIWDTSTGKELVSVNAWGSWGSAFGPQRQALLTLNGKIAQVWDVKTGTAVSTFSRHQSRIMAFAFSPDGRAIVTGSEEGEVKIWEKITGRELASIRAHSEWRQGYPAIRSLAFSPSGRQVITAGSIDGTAKIWSWRRSQPAVVITNFPSIDPRISPFYSGPRFSDDGRKLLTFFESTHGPEQTWTVRIWDSESGKPLADLPHTNWDVAATFSADARRVLTFDERIEPGAILCEPVGLGW